MNHRTIVIMGLFSWALMGQSDRAVGDEIKTVRECLAKYIQAKGGQKKLDSIRTARMIAKRSGMGGVDIPLQSEYKKPGKMRLEFTYQGMKGVQAIDGKKGWYLMPFAGQTEPTAMPEPMYNMVADQSDYLGPLVNAEKKGHKVSLIGKEKIDGTDVYKLKVDKKGGYEEFYYLDAQKFLPIRMRAKREFQGMNIEFELSFSDYKPVNGIMMPYRVKQVGGPIGEMEISYDKIEFNVDIPDKRFEMPAAAPAAPKPAKKGGP